MASLTQKKNGYWHLQFMPRSERRQPDQLKPTKPKRLSIALGGIDEDEAKQIKKHVEELVKAQGKREPNSASAKWRDQIADHDNALYLALLRVGLVPMRLQDQEAAIEAAAASSQPNTLARFVDDYIKRRGDVKGTTATFYGHSRRCLVEFFGATRPLDRISPSEAEDFRRWLAAPINEKDPKKGGQGLADNTVRRRCGMAKQFFRDAMRRRLIAENPFGDMKGCMVKGNPDREYFVTREEAAGVLEACPDAQWRLLFALSRFGGLRCPSEHLGLRWEDIDWAGDRMTIHSPKTEHHDGKGIRVVPIFPELRPYLDEVWEQAEKGIPWVITSYRMKNVNLRTQLERIIGKAGLQPWPKLFQNLRSTRETELAETFPIQVVCAWIGNSEAVAKKHYLQVTEEHFRRASSTAPTETGLQFGLHFPPAKPCNATHKKSKSPGNAGLCMGLPSIAPPKVGVTGLEPVTSTV